MDKLWKNEISNNLKNAIKEEIFMLMDDKTKEIFERNKILENENIFLRKQLKGLKNEI